VRIYFDTSAVIPLVLEEPRTAEAQSVWAGCTEVWAWDWLRVEAEAALARRNADSASWAAWRSIVACFHFVGISGAEHATLCAFNRGLALRAADAGHLFVFDRVLEQVADVRLCSFDSEMCDAARRISLPLYEA
jgi:predicted nucleic acid-binding protein